LIDPFLPLQPPRHSVAASLRTAASGPTGTVVAMITALGGLLTAWQTYQESQQTARASYETLREASQKNTAQIDALLRGQIDLRNWVEELSSRLEQRQVTTEKAVARKVTRSSAPPLPPPVGPAPKAPPVPVVPEPAELPSFDEIEEP